jgi:hypothetical protein
VRVHMLRNPAASYGCGLKEGQTGDVEPSIGRVLVALGIAEELPEPIRAVPDRPAIAQAKPPQITPAAPQRAAKAPVLNVKPKHKDA